MSSQTRPKESQHHVLANYLRTSEFMDTAGKYSFRGYLTPELKDDALSIVDQCLATVIASQSRMNNGQLYDEVHARLCGPEPMVRDQLLLFMQLFSESLSKWIAVVVSSEDTSTADKASDASAIRTTSESEPQVLTATDRQLPANSEKGASLINLAMAGIDPSQTINRLTALASLKRADPNAALVFDLLTFVDCTNEEAAQLLAVSIETIGSRFLRATLAISQL